LKKIIFGMLGILTISVSSNFVSSCDYNVADFDKDIKDKKSFILYLYATASDDSKYGEKGFYDKFYSDLKKPKGKDKFFRPGDIYTSWNSFPVLIPTQKNVTLKKFDSNKKNSSVSFLSFSTSVKNFKSIAYTKHVIEFAAKSAYKNYFGASTETLKDYLKPFEDKWFKDGILLFVRNGVYQGIEDIVQITNKVSAGQPINVKYQLFFSLANFYFAADKHKPTNDNLWISKPDTPKPKPKPKPGPKY